MPYRKVGYLEQIWYIIKCKLDPHKPKLTAMPRFQYIGMAKDGTINGFTLYADVISRTKTTVTYRRYMDFGKIVTEKPVTVSVKDFKYYYKRLSRRTYRKCLKIARRKYGYYLNMS